MSVIPWIVHEERGIAFTFAEALQGCESPAKFHGGIEDDSDFPRCLLLIWIFNI